MKQAHEIVAVALQIFPFFNSPAFPVKCPDPAGYFGLLPRQVFMDEPFHALVSFGNIPPEKRRGRWSRAQEKILRLRTETGHLSSWQTRDPAKNEYGGAILAGDWYLSFAGLPEELDEVFMLVVAERCELAPHNEFEKIAAISGTTKLFHQLSRAIRPRSFVHQH